MAADFDTAVSSGEPEFADTDGESHAVPADESLRFISFGSGSSGNCAYLGTSSGGILIDAGVDANKVFEVLALNGVTPDMVKGVCLTHDHGDHVRYVYQLCAVTVTFTYIALRARLTEYCAATAYRAASRIIMRQYSRKYRLRLPV